MIKARFGGLFSSLNKRDIQTLTDFEIFLGTAIDNELADLEDNYVFRPGDALVPDGESFFGIGGSVFGELGGPGEFTSASLEDIYKYFKNMYDELHWQCQNPSIGNQEIEIGVKHQCRIWLTKVAPVLKKLKKLVDRSRNESLD
jgi:hypothetical protein